MQPARRCGERCGDSAKSESHRLGLQHDLDSSAGNPTASRPFSSAATPSPPIRPRASSQADEYRRRGPRRHRRPVFDITLSAAGGANETVTVDSNGADVCRRSPPRLAARSTTRADHRSASRPRRRRCTALARGLSCSSSPARPVPAPATATNGIFISKIGGGQNFGNEVLLDGASQTRSENGSSFDEEAPSVEAISEFKVTTSTRPSPSSAAPRAVLENFVTKSRLRTAITAAHLRHLPQRGSRRERAGSITAVRPSIHRREIL